MKSFTVLMLAVVAGLLIGCTDQTSIIEPTMPQQSLAAPAPPPLNHGVWNIDRIVYAVETGTSYHIYGRIEWFLSENGGEYTFSTNVKTEVTAMTEQGAIVTVGEESVNKGEVSKSGNTRIVSEYATFHDGDGLRFTNPNVKF